MKKLFDGYEHFKKNVHDNNRDMFKKLAKAQNPEVMFISCSDSRVDPNLLTNTKPGELFVLRNAGNIVPPHGASNGGEQATIEYAVAVLKVSSIIICGHSDCGAMKGLLHLDHLREFPKVTKWLANSEATLRIVKEKHEHTTHHDDGILSNAVETNVLVQLDNLRTIPVVNARVAQGSLELHGWVYDIENGEIQCYNYDLQQFVALVENMSYMPDSHQIEDEKKAMC